MDLSIIIVNYKTLELTDQCVRSIKEANMSDLSYEIILVDNASLDGSLEALKEAHPDCIFIENKENLGFSKANNQGLRIAKGRYLLLLNSDTIVETLTLKQCVAFLEHHSGVDVLGCKVVLEDGSLDPACKRSFPTPANSLYHFLGLGKRFPKSRRFGEYNLTYVDEDSIFSVDCIMGAFMMMRREILNTVGYLDEDYFMYGEDIDWCYRMKQAGHQIIYYPKVKVFHYKKASGIGKRNPKVISAFYDSMGIFFKKHYHNQYSPLLTALVLSGTKVLKGIALIKNKGKNER
ncbi:MAG: glycosyltransferase family 2 protein [Eubacteriaceae bacterium]|jgi:GT2 family glycosyltransferase|nr:glycosyltransferase family 2 protein [Eubacteriaceae bacterium]